MKAPPALRGLDFDKKEVDNCVRKNFLLRISIELSKACNLKCPYCFTNAEYKKTVNSELSLDDFKNIILQAKKLGAKTITLGGGEPLIYPKIRDLVSFINFQKLIPLIFTNGIAITKDLAQFLYKNDASVIMKFNSLDKPEIQNEMVGGVEVFERMQKTISILKEVGFNKSNPTRLSIESVICHTNLLQIPKIFRFARKNNIYPYIELITPTGRGKNYKNILSKEEAKDIFYKLLKIDEKEFGYTWIPKPPQVAATCKYYFTSIYINSDGKVQPCPGTDINLGNFKKEKLSDILNKTETKKIRDIKGNLKGRCGDCQFCLDCYGCRGAVYNLTGDLFGDYLTCWIPEKYPPLKQIRIEVTQKCNQKCKYCYVEYLTKQKSGKEISFEEIKNIIIESVKQGLKTVSLTGGEPFLRYNLIKKVIKFSLSKGLETGILTNATLTTKNQLKELKKLGLNWIRISLDGTTKEINSSCRDDKNFENIIKTINWSKELGLYTIIRATANNKNSRDLLNLIDLAVKLKVDRIDIQPIYPINNKRIDKEFVLNVQNHKKIAAELLKYRRKFKNKQIKIIIYYNWFEFILPEYKGEAVYMASCGRTFCSIDSYGNVKTCSPNTRVLGNIRKQKILNIWNNSKHLKQFRKNEKFGICKKCSKFELCLNSCPAATYNLYKDLKHSPPLCPIVRENENGAYL